VVIINEADSLSRDAQAALRRTMEKYMSNMRIILCANSTSRLIAPIKSRCLLMRVAAPCPEDVRATDLPKVYLSLTNHEDGNRTQLRSKEGNVYPPSGSG
jgi:hypothetical protein